MYMYEREGSDLLCVCLLYVYVIYVYVCVRERDVDPVPARFPLRVMLIDPRSDDHA
jgi:hypothetical protein